METKDQSLTTTAALDLHADSVGEIMLNAPLLEQIGILAKRMASAKVTIPKHLIGSEGDCYAVVMQAVQWRMNPYVVAQKTHLVNGALGYEAQLVNAVVQSSGAISGGFKYEYDGDGEKLRCRVGAKLKGDDVVTWGEWLSVSDVTTRNSPLWKTNPKQQMGYLQVKNWARLYCPAAILGVYTPDELATITEATPAPAGNVSDLNDALRKNQADGETIEGECEPASDEGDPVTLESLLKEVEETGTLIELGGIIEASTAFAKNEGVTDEDRTMLREAIRKRQAELQAIEDEQNQ